MKTVRITANLPGHLEDTVRRQVVVERYPTQSDYGVGVGLWDIYARQPHTITGPLLREPAWVVANYVRDLLEELGQKPPNFDIVPFRFTVSVPEVLMPLVRIRSKEERYRSISAYFVGLVLHDLKRRAPDPKKVPHHKLSPLMREPAYIRDAIFIQLAKDFGNPKRAWPGGIGERIGDLIQQQRELPLG